MFSPLTPHNGNGTSPARICAGVTVRRGKLPYERASPGGRLAGRGGIYHVDERASNDRDVRDLPHALHMPPLGDAEADPHGQLRVPAHTVDELREVVRQVAPCARHAGDADAVDEPSRMLAAEHDALLGAGGREHAHDAQAVLLQRLAQLARLVRREVGDDERVHSRLRAVRGVCGDAVAQDGVVVAHEDERQA